MKIGIIGAMEEKLRCCVTKSKTVKLSVWAVGNLYRPTEWNRGCASEIGHRKVAAALGATLLLEHCKPDVILTPVLPVAWHQR